MNNTTNERYDAATLPGLTFEAFDLKTGCRIREATAEERAAYLAQPCRHPAFRTRFVVGAVAIEERNTVELPDNQGNWKWL